MSKGWWELIFLMVVMKIPVAYLVGVVWWAVKAEPRPEEGAVLVAVPPPSPPDGFFGPFRARRQGPRPGPHGAPVRRPAPRMAPVATRAHGRER